MQPKKTYYEVTLIGNKKSKVKKVFAISFIIIFIISFLTFLLLSVLGIINKKYLDYKTYYYVYLISDAQNATEAEQKANNYRVRGGAGLTQLIDNHWCILLSLYLNKKDAVKVSEQLLSQNMQVQIGTLKTAHLTIKNMDSNQIEIAQNMYSHYIQTIESLYNLSISLDNNTLTESSAQVRVNQLSLLWLHRAQELASTIDVKNADSASHPLINVYNLALQVSGLLQFLADENNYTTSLLTYTSLARKITLQMAQITI